MRNCARRASPRQPLRATSRRTATSLTCTFADVWHDRRVDGLHIGHEFVDMSVKLPYDKDWKARVRTRIKRSDGAIALISKNLLTSSGQKWELQCAKEERRPVRAVWAYTDDRTNIDGFATYVWSDKNICEFIDLL